MLSQIICTAFRGSKNNCLTHLSIAQDVIEQA
jgi:hypothetical protein